MWGAKIADIKAEGPFWNDCVLDLAHAKADLVSHPVMAIEFIDYVSGRHTLPEIHEHPHCSREFHAPRGGHTTNFHIRRLRSEL